MYYEGHHPYTGLDILLSSLEKAQSDRYKDEIRKLIDKELIALANVQARDLKDYLKPLIKPVVKKAVLKDTE
jgi:hypothetical protein